MSKILTIPKQWTIKDDKLLKSLVSENKSFKEISLIMNRTSSSCQNRSFRLGFKNNYIFKKWFVNENFWSVPNLINCYWAGVSAADSSIIFRDNKYYLYTLEWQIGDKEHLEIFKNTINYTGNIKIYERINDLKPTETRWTAKIIINSNKWAEDLKNNFNIIPNKTKRLGPPNITDDYLLLSWLSGYCDGDGTIHYDNYRKNLLMGFCSSSKLILDFIKSLIDRIFPIGIRNTKTKVRKLKHANCWYLSICGIKVAIIIDYLRQFSLPLLSRKWEQSEILSRIKEYKLLRPDLFKTLIIPPQYLNNQQDIQTNIISQIPESVVREYKE